VVSAADSEELACESLVKSEMNIVSVSEMAFLGRENGHMSGFIAPHIFLANTRLGLHDASRGRSASAHERGANRGAQIIRRGKKEAGRAESGPFGVEPYLLGRTTDCAWMMVLAVIFVQFSVQSWKAVLVRAS